MLLLCQSQNERCLRTMPTLGKASLTAKKIRRTLEAHRTNLNFNQYPPVV